MFTASTSGAGSASRLYFFELQLQCGLARHSFERLKEYCRTEVEHDYNSTEKNSPNTVVEVLADCAVFLSAVGNISKLLYPSGRGQNNEQSLRCTKLKSLLNIGDLPQISSRTVRNDFEHFDERIDRQLSEDPDAAYIQVHLDEKLPPEGYVLKRLDPNTLTISHLNHELSLEDCMKDIEEVERGLKESDSKKWREAFKA